MGTAANHADVDIPLGEYGVVVVTAAHGLPPPCEATHGRRLHNMKARPHGRIRPDFRGSAPSHGRSPSLTWLTVDNPPDRQDRAHQTGHKTCQAEQNERPQHACDGHDNWILRVEQCAD
jgi:hypothetical protein